MTEQEFLISRALGVFNPQYGRNIKVENCEIKTIPADPQSDRGYEITTPHESTFFRIRFYVRFADMDRTIPARLEVTMPYVNGALGDEVYVIHSAIANFWRTEGYKFDPIVPRGVPFGAIIAQNEDLITTEDGKVLIMEYGIQFQ